MTAAVGMDRQQFEVESDYYGGVDMLYVPSQDIWRPDIVLYNKYADEFVNSVSIMWRVHWSSGRVSDS